MRGFVFAIFLSWGIEVEAIMQKSIIHEYMEGSFGVDMFGSCFLIKVF